MIFLLGVLIIIGTAFFFSSFFYIKEILQMKKNGIKTTAQLTNIKLMGSGRSSYCEAMVSFKDQSGKQYNVNYQSEPTYLCKYIDAKETIKELIVYKKESPSSIFLLNDNVKLRKQIAGAVGGILMILFAGSIFFLSDFGKML